MNGLLFVFGKGLTEGVDTKSRWRCDGYGVLCRNEKALAKGRDGSSGDALGETLVVDIGDIVDAEASGTGCGVGVFAASLNVEDITLVAVTGCECAVMLDELFVVGGVSDALEIAAVNGFRFVVLGDGDGFEAFSARRDVNVASHKIHEVCALQEELGHPGVVVVGGGDVAIAALLRFGGANGVRNERAEGLPGETGSGDGLLRVVEPVAIRILRTNEDGAGGTRGSNAVAGDSAINTEHVDVVAKDLKIVAGVIARGEAFVVKHGLARVCCHLQMTAEAGGSPGGVAGVTGHRGIGVGEVLVVFWHL